MKDEVDPGDRLLHSGGIGDVPFRKLNPFPDAGQILLPPGGNIIQHPHAIPARDERLYQMRADKAGTAGDERNPQMTKS